MSPNPEGVSFARISPRIIFEYLSSYICLVITAEKSALAHPAPHSLYPRLPIPPLEAPHYQPPSYTSARDSSPQELNPAASSSHSDRIQRHPQAQIPTRLRLSQLKQYLPRSLLFQRDRDPGVSFPGTGKLYQFRRGRREVRIWSMKFNPVLSEKENIASGTRVLSRYLCPLTHPSWHFLVSNSGASPCERPDGRATRSAEPKTMLGLRHR